MISALQAAAVLPRERFEPVPVYISKQGKWYTGASLLELERYADLDALMKSATEVAVASGPGRTMYLIPVSGPFMGRSQPVVLDVAFLGFHGGSGENGAFQGVCETMGVPFTGCGVLASALGMDKVRAKATCAAAGVPVVPGLEITEAAWRGSETKVAEQLIADYGLPLIVKPVRLGSSIGISRAATAEALDAAIEEAFRYDASVLVEQCVPHLREINASVLGNGPDHQVSVLEEPVGSDAVLSFQDKYMRAGSAGKSGVKHDSGGMASLDRLIPAPIADALAERIRTLAGAAFEALDGSGVARIDFLLNEETSEVYFNEINTIPGSFSFYLWGPSGIPFPELTERLVDLAIQRFEERNVRVQSYDVNLLAERAVRGLKGAKS